MTNLFIPKEVTGSTRFCFEFTLTSSMVRQLIDDFKEDYPEYIHAGKSKKLINKEEKNGIEIGQRFVSFFPPLEEHKIEEVKRRLYKHIAKKSEVYHSTSKENLVLARNSLLSGDVRSSASLLYYSVHKFISGQMYEFLNKTLKIEDYQIDFKEVEHFTGSNFGLFIVMRKNIKIEDIDHTNYNSFFCIHNNGRVNPYLLIKTIHEDLLEKNTNLFSAYIDLMCLGIFNVHYTEANKEFFENIAKDYKEKKEKKIKTSQIDDVKGSIAYCLMKGIENPKESSLWELYALLLRLYLLRQTADYEFDFEVSTSLRELSSLLSTVSKYFYINNQNNVTDTVDFKNNEKDIFMEDGTTEKETFGGELYENKSVVKYYNIDVSFPFKNIDETPLIFLTAIHLDSYFNKEEIFYILNLTEGITNNGKYFVFSGKYVLSILLYVYINDEGRWTAWFSNSSGIYSVSPADLIMSFNEFISKLQQGYNELLGKDAMNNMVASNPIFYTQEDRTFSISGLSKLEYSYLQRKVKLERYLSLQINHRLKLDKSFYATLRNSGIDIEIDLVINYSDSMSTIPIQRIVFQEFQNHKNNIERKIYLTILVAEESDIEKYDIKVITSRLKKLLADKYSFANQMKWSFLVIETQEGIKRFLNNPDENEFLVSIVEELNTSAYDLIEASNFEASKVILDKCLIAADFSVLPYATLAMWYLRNEQWDIDESEKLGVLYYEKSMEIHPQYKYIEDLKQKYYFELSRFYLKRKKNHELGGELLVKAYELGNLIYYKDVLELMDEAGLINEKEDEVAATNEDYLKNES